MLEIQMWEIEVNVDGVLANMDGSYAPYVKDIIPDFSEETHIFSWGIPEIRENYPKAFEIIQSLWTNPTFFKSLPRYPKVEKAMIRLGQITKDNSKIIIHTHVLTGDEIYDERYAWLDTLRKETGVPFDIEISQGSKKGTRTTSTIIIEDNVTNIAKSNAEYKILIRRGHNRNFNENDLGKAKKAFVVKDFYEAVKVVEKILEEKKVA